MKKNLQTNFSTRQYMLSKDFEIYYYNDFGGTRTALHRHDYYEFYFFIEGDVSLMVYGKDNVLKTGDVAIIPPGTQHQAIVHSSEKPYRRFVFWISKEYSQKLFGLSPSYGYIMQHAGVNHDYIIHNDVISFNTIQSKVFNLINEIHSDRFGKDAAISLSVNDLILHLNRILYEKNNPVLRTDDGSLYRSISGYIDDHLDEDLSLDNIARQFYVSKYYISHLFKDSTGLSIHQYIIKKRLAACRNAIIGNSEICDTFSLYGFKDYSSFYKAFRKEFGMSPRACKKTAPNIT